MALPLSIVDRDDIEPVRRHVASCEVDGLRSSRDLCPEGYSLFASVAELEDGAELRWGARHGEEALYVESGALRVGSRTCPTDGALILESNAPLTAVASGATRIVHFGRRDGRVPTEGLYGPPSERGHGAHVLGPGAWFRSGEREGVSARWFADSSCPTCRVTLMHVAQPRSNHRGPAHSHSQDEVIYVLEGSGKLGAHELRPGTALSIAGDARYMLGSGAAGYSFLNYRCDVSLQTLEPGSEPILEGGLARGGEAVEDFR